MENVYCSLRKSLTSLDVCRVCAGILLALMLVTSDMKAQCPTTCPTDIAPLSDSLYPWTHATVPVSFGGPCAGTAEYCYRVLNPWPVPGQTTIQSVLICLTFGDSGCIGGNAQDIINAASQAVFDYVMLIEIPYLPACNDTLAWSVGEVYEPSCWAVVERDSVTRVAFCSDSGAYCVQRCDVCNYGGGQTREFDCIYVEIGTPSCSEAPNLLSSWSYTHPKTCYHIPCGQRVH